MGTREGGVDLCLVQWFYFFSRMGHVQVVLKVWRLCTTCKAYILPFAICLVPREFLNMVLMDSLKDAPQRSTGILRKGSALLTPKTKKRQPYHKDWGPWLWVFRKRCASEPLWKTAHFPAPPNHCFLRGTWFVMLRAHLHVAFGGTVVINYCSGCPCGCSKGSLRGMEANLSHETMQTWEHPGMSHWRVILVDRTTSWTIFRPMFVVLLFLAHVFVYKTILALFFVHRSHDMYTTERDFLRPTSGAPPSRGATEC